VAFAHCTKRGRQTHFAEVMVCMESGLAVAQGLVTVMIVGERSEFRP
jgi:acyl-coenzyme A thioesterase PaaI-like protein